MLKNSRRFSVFILLDCTKSVCATNTCLITCGIMFVSPGKELLGCLFVMMRKRRLLKTHQYNRDERRVAYEIMLCRTNIRKALLNGNGERLFFWRRKIKTLIDSLGLKYGGKKDF